MTKAIRYSCLVALLIFLALIGLLAGPGNLSTSEILSGLLRSEEGSIGQTIVWTIRIPRILVSILAGGCLGLAGVLIQLSTRSNLGDPNLFGVGGGAAIFLAAITAGVITTGSFGVFLGAITSSLLVSLILFKLISSRDLSPIKLAIMGIAVGALTVSIGTSIISHGRVFPTQVIGLVAGSFTSSTWEIFRYLLVTFIACFVITLLISKRFFPMMLSDILSRSLGVDPIKTRAFSMSLVGILTGASVYAGGLIGFVGLISPHISRKILGNSPLQLVIGSSLIGSISTLSSDQIARLLFAPTEFPVGMATTIVGAPLMMYLAMKLK
ncbi:MAG: FecCD family ABC transporter permease [Dehalococcoidia bacterium]